MSAFVLFASLLTPLAVTRAIHLDGLLLAARERAEGVLDLSRPLECVAMDRGVYRASAGILLCPDLLGNAPTTVNRTWRFRTETREGLAYFRLHDEAGKPLPTKERQLPVANSPWKPHFAEKELHSAVSTVAWQFVGDAHAVLRLARAIDNIGPSQNQGFGRVRSWSIEVSDADPDAAGWYAGDRVLRNLPVELAPRHLLNGGTGFSRGRDRVAPPYWDPNDRRDCLVPVPRGLVATYDDAHARLGLAA